MNDWYKRHRTVLPAVNRMHGPQLEADGQQHTDDERHGPGCWPRVDRAVGQPPALLVDDGHGQIERQVATLIGEIIERRRRGRHGESSIGFPIGGRYSKAST